MGVLVAGAVAYLCCWPIPAAPVSWSAPVFAGYKGSYAENTRLANLRTIDIGSEFGPEHLAIGPDGKLYAAMTSGNLLRMDPDGSHREVFANTQGRVLGFAFDADGRMIAADAMKGLLAIAADGQVSLLADRVGADDPIRYPNAVVVAQNGTVYFTDASTRFAPADWGGTYEASVLDILEQAASGRVLAYDPPTSSTRVVARGLSFANGIALGADGHTLFVAETGRYRIWKIDGDARDVDVQSGSAQAVVLLDNLPGYPDNLMRGRDGRIWAGLFKPRNSAADALSQKPFMREVLLRLPRSLLPTGKPYGHVFAFDESGRIVEDLQDPDGVYPETTGATETRDRLYVHSLHAPAIGWVPRERASADAVDSAATTEREDIYILRSVRERETSGGHWCTRARTGFDPFEIDAERIFSFWSVRSRPEDGRIVDAKQLRVASLHACFGATAERARQNFYAEGELGALAFRGIGECEAVMVDFPEPKLFPVRCQLTLKGLPPPFVGGLLVTSTMISAAAFGTETDPAGYTQASIATVRLWREIPNSRGDRS
ncbi:MAG: SMP-30/gluconolactonase/LRE family protein [Rhodanobacteraceae bacterium]